MNTFLFIREVVKYNIKPRIDRQDIVEMIYILDYGINSLSMVIFL